MSSQLLKQSVEGAASTLYVTNNLTVAGNEQVNGQLTTKLAVGSAGLGVSTQSTVTVPAGQVVDATVVGQKPLTLSEPGLYLVSASWTTPDPGAANPGRYNLGLPNSASPNVILNSCYYMVSVGYLQVPVGSTGSAQNKYLSPVVCAFDMGRVWNGTFGLLFTGLANPTPAPIIPTSGLTNYYAPPSSVATESYTTTAPVQAISPGVPISVFPTLTCINQTGSPVPVTFEISAQRLSSNFTGGFLPGVFPQSL
jgi:hypothetical protein